MPIVHAHCTSEFRQHCPLSACDWKRLPLCFCAFQRASRWGLPGLSPETRAEGSGNATVCLLGGLVFCLEQNQQKLRGSWSGRNRLGCRWRQTLGAGDGWKLRLCGFHRHGPGLTQDEDLRQLKQAGHFDLGVFLQGGSCVLVPGYLSLSTLTWW